MKNLFSPMRRDGIATPRKEKALESKGLDSKNIKNDNNDSTIQPVLPSSPRARRLLRALIKGAVMREDLDGVVGTSNSPEYVSKVRETGWQVITERLPKIDIDGKLVHVGRYHLTQEHQALAAKMLSNGG